MKNKNFFSLAIETSCDDTSLALFNNDKLVDSISDTSLNEMKKYGGIVPEISARKHCKVINDIFDKMIKRNKISSYDIKQIFYTSTPGLPGSLHIGKIFATTLSFLVNAKLIPINHIYGHIFSFAINRPDIIKYPFIALVVSGGHTSIYLVKSKKNIEILNQTTDDACGEVLDKIGRVLKLEYPGGVAIDKIYDASQTNCKLIKHHSPETDFTFSGFKTHVSNLINSLEMKKQKYNVAEIASSSLKWIIDEIMIKMNYYADKYKIKNIVIGGGVSANSLLRSEISKNKQWKVFLPEMKFTGDNAAMIGFFGLIN